MVLLERFARLNSFGVSYFRHGNTLRNLLMTALLLFAMLLVNRDAGAFEWFTSLL